jgi:hypothetical protein
MSSSWPSGNAPQRASRINTSGFTRPRVLLFGIALLVGFLILVGIGAAGPTVIQYRETATTIHTISDQPDATGFDSFDFKLVPRNQLLWVETRLSRPSGAADNVEIRATMSMKLTVTGINSGDQASTVVAQEDIEREVICRANEQFCDWFDLWNQDFIYFNEYRVAVVFEQPTLGVSNNPSTDPRRSMDVLIQHKVLFVNASYTEFELGWKYTFFTVTLIALLIPRWGYAWRLAVVPRRSRSFEQRWTLALLISLVFFNDPFFAAAANRGGDVAAACTAWYVLVIGAFLFLLLLHWLCLFHDVRLMGMGEEPKRGACYWGPKVMLVLLISLMIVGVYFAYRFAKTGSTTYSAIDDSPKAVQGVLVVLSLLMTAYMIWILVLALGSCGTLAGLGPGMHFLYGTSLVTFVFSVIGIFSAAFYPVATSGALFLGFYGMCNLYVWALAFAYGPVQVDDEEEEVCLQWAGSEGVDMDLNGIAMVPHHKLHDEGDDGYDEREAMQQQQEWQPQQSASSAGDSVMRQDSRRQMGSGGTFNV